MIAEKDLDFLIYRQNIFQGYRMFITFEGIEGSGKSTQARLLKNFLESKGMTVTLTREPGWGEIGKFIRELILGDNEIEIHPYTELCLFCADRAQHVKEFIKPRLDNNEVVICDRYTDSTIVYQGHGRKIDLTLVKRMAEASSLGIKPDITILLNLPVREGLRRLETRGTISRIDEEPVEFHEMIRQGYTIESHLDRKRFRIVNAMDNQDRVHEEIKKIINTHLSTKKG